MHIVQDFEPVFARFAEQGLREVWRDDWLWGHQVFQKTRRLTLQPSHAPQDETNNS